MAYLFWVAEVKEKSRQDIARESDDGSNLTMDGYWSEDKAASDESPPGNDEIQKFSSYLRIHQVDVIAKSIGTIKPSSFTLPSQALARRTLMAGFESKPSPAGFPGR